LKNGAAATSLPWPCFRERIILENYDKKPLIHANQGIQKKPILQTSHLIGDGKFFGRNPTRVSISAD
jgi:hypothetical protein